MENIDNLMLEHLKRIQADLGELKKLRSEVRDGFASMRQHLGAINSDINLLERRAFAVEEDMERVKRRLDIIDE